MQTIEQTYRDITAPNMVAHVAVQLRDGDRIADLIAWRNPRECSHGETMCKDCLPLWNQDYVIGRRVDLDAATIENMVRAEHAIVAAALIQNS